MMAIDRQLKVVLVNFSEVFNQCANHASNSLKKKKYS